MQLPRSGAQVLLVVAWLLASATVHGQSPCDAYFPFDGSLSDATGNGYDGRMIAAGDAPAAPSFGEGRNGQALHITGKSAMRSYLDLHHESCPQFTITAWFRLPSVGEPGSQAIVSTGARGGIPAIVARSSSLTLYGSGNGLTQKDAIRDGNTWIFVAATFDYDAREYRLYWRDRSLDGKLSDRPYDAEDAVWIGTRSDSLKDTARDLYVDDLRIYGRVLDPEEIREAVRNARMPAGQAGPTAPAVSDETQAWVGGAPCRSSAGCGAGQYCARDLTCHPDSHLPLAAANDDSATSGSSANSLTGIEAPASGSPSTVDGLGDAATDEIAGAGALPEALQSMTPETLDCRIDTTRILANRPADVDYRADCVVDVTAALTIEPGVVIQFEEQAGLGVFDGGTLNAVGTEAQPIVLQAADGSSGQWRGVHVLTRSPANVLEHVRIENAGSDYVYCCREASSLRLEDAQIALRNVHLLNGRALGLVAAGTTEFTQFSRLRVSSHAGYAASLTWTAVSALDGTGSDYSGNSQDFVYLSTARIESPAMLRKLNVPYLLPGEVVHVTAALTIEAGTELVVPDNGGMGVYDNGSLSADGTAADPVIWRGARPSPGSWRGIHVETNSSSNRLRHVEIRHAGSDYVYCCNEVAALLVKDGRMSLENSTITESAGCAVHVAPAADFTASGNTFLSNQGGDQCYAPEVPVTYQGSCMTGEVRLFSGHFPPRGWAFANGDLLDTGQYSALYSIIGTRYGGDGQAGFALPNITGQSTGTGDASAIICVNGVYPSRG